MTRFGAPRSSMYSSGASGPGGLNKTSLMTNWEYPVPPASQLTASNNRNIGELKRVIYLDSLNMLQEDAVYNGSLSDYRHLDPFPKQISEAGRQFAASHGVGEVFQPELIVDRRPLVSQDFVPKDLPRLFHHLVADQLGHLDCFES